MVRRASAYGGTLWSPRTASHAQEIGEVWASCGVSSETDPLKVVLLHAPGSELGASEDPDAVQMLAPLDPGRARAQHDALASAYRNAGVQVLTVDPPPDPPPNLLYVADLVFMTPEGAVLCRPASTVRAGEERLVARRLADLGIPILSTIRGTGTFEGADAAWLDPTTVLLATGLRTNEVGARQVEAVLSDLGVTTVRTRLPDTAMHLMGGLRFADADLAIAWPGRLLPATLEILGDRGFTVLEIPSEQEALTMALNLVTLGPRKVLMPAGNPVTQEFYEQAGIACVTVDVSELAKGAGAIGCMTGILERARPAGTCQGR